MLYIALAARAVAENWGQSYSSPMDADSPLPPGTLDQCEADGAVWHRIWCADGTARNVPPTGVPCEQR